MLSATIGPRLIIRWSTAHQERCNIWFLVVGESALARKTSGASALSQAVAWIRGEGDDLVRIMRVHRLSDAGLVSSLDVVGQDAEEARRKAEDRGDEGGHEADRPVPVSWILLVNEIAPIWRGDNATPTWVLDTQRILLSIFDGRLSSNTRQTHVADQECFVTMIGNIPPNILREQTTLSMISSGWVGRWLIVPQPGPVRNISFPNVDNEAGTTMLRRHVGQLMYLARQVDRVNVYPLWSNEALAVRDKWYTSHRSKLQEVPASDEFAVASAELFERQQATAAKLATLVAVSRQLYSRKTLLAMDVGPEDAQWAQSLIDSSMAWLVDTLRDAGAADTSQRAKVEARILRYLETVGAVDMEHAVEIRQIADATKGGSAGRRDVYEAIDALLQTGHIEVAEISGYRRPKRVVWLDADHKSMPSS
jgi:hypothetical protein